MSQSETDRNRERDELKEERGQRIDDLELLLSHVTTARPER